MVLDEIRKYGPCYRISRENFKELVSVLLGNRKLWIWTEKISCCTCLYFSILIHDVVSLCEEFAWDSDKNCSLWGEHSESLNLESENSQLVRSESESSESDETKSNDCNSENSESDINLFDNSESNNTHSIEFLFDISTSRNSDDKSILKSNELIDDLFFLKFTYLKKNYLKIIEKKTSFKISSIISVFKLKSS